MQTIYRIISAILVLFLVACSQIATPTQTSSTALPAPTDTPMATLTPTMPPTSTSTSVPTPTLVPMTDLISGINYDNGYGFKNGYISPESDNILSNVIKPMGVNWIAIYVPCFMETATSVSVDCSNRGSPTDESLIHAIQYAKSLGMRVMLKPNLTFLNDQIPLELKFNSDVDWNTFFENYTTAVTHYAVLSTQNQVDYFCVGTEMDQTTYRTKNWRNVIKSVREVYPGPITYGVTTGNETTVGWWDDLDSIGIDLYYAVSQIKNPTLEQMKKGWTNQVKYYESLSKKWDRPILLTEAGYTSEDGTNIKPWAEGLDQPIDLQEQADGFQALLESFQGKPWWIGVFWFHETVMPAESGPSGQLWEFSGKPAENIVRAFNGQPPFPTQTPIPNYATNEKDYYYVYKDSLENSWEFPASQFGAELLSSEQVFQGASSVKAHLEPWQGISFWIDPAMDLNNFDFLEFYIYIDKVKNSYYPNINVDFNDADGNMMQEAPDIMRPGYVEGGELTLGSWHRVRIPFSELGVINNKVRTLNFSHHAQVGVVDIFIDNIAFSKYLK